MAIIAWTVFNNSLVERNPEPGVYEFSGRAEIEELNDKYHLGIPEDDEYQTLAGYILYNLEVIPRQGETFEIGGIRFTILKKSAAKIELVRVNTAIDDIPAPPSEE